MLLRQGQSIVVDPTVDGRRHAASLLLDRALPVSLLRLSIPINRPRSAPGIDELDPAVLEVTDGAGGNGGALEAADGGDPAIELTDRPSRGSALRADSGELLAGSLSTEIRQLYGPWSASRAVSGKAQRGGVLVLGQRVATLAGAARGVPGGRRGHHPEGEPSDDRDLRVNQPLALSAKHETAGSRFKVRSAKSPSAEGR